MRLYETYVSKQQIYKVGGSVRDELLNKILGYNLSPHDIDYVAVGFTQNEFEEKYPTAKLVGKDFPVYLLNGNEIALARTERKIGTGYKGFETNINNVSLDDDLGRRDLTINAIAKDEDGNIYDPYNGIDDIKNKKLKHVTNSFAEDPLRVYRVARFAAKLPDFVIDNDTKKLMRSLKNELATLSSERVWKETENALKSQAPRKFFDTLFEIGVLDVHFPELAALSNFPAGREYHIEESHALDHVLSVLERVSSTNPITRWAALCHDLGKAVTHKNIDGKDTFYNHDKEGIRIIDSLCNKLKCPTVYKKAAEMSSEFHMTLLHFLQLRPGTLIKKLDVIRKFPTGPEEFFKIVEADGKVKVWNTVSKLYKAFDVTLPKDKQGLGKKSGNYLHQLRVSKLKQILRTL